MGDSLKHFLDIARKIFKETNYHASERDIKSLAENMLFLDKRGLDKINQKLIKSGRKIWDIFTEHNFAAMLISRHNHQSTIIYEPDDGLHYPPDFKIMISEITYWVQIKNLAKLERENRKDKIIDQIKRNARKIPIGKFFSCDLSEGFVESDVVDLMQFIISIAKYSIEGQDYLFSNTESYKAKLTFWLPKGSRISNLTLSFSRDNIVEVTGLAKDQIQKSLINAAKAFLWNVEKSNINLVAMDADRNIDIDLCDAMFGTEFEIYSIGKHTWSRQSNGFFQMQDFSKKVAGVIAMKRKERNPVSSYYLMLFMNDIFKDRLEDLKKLLPFDKVVFSNMRPSFGEGNFKLA